MIKGVFPYFYLLVLVDAIKNTNPKTCASFWVYEVAGCHGADTLSLMFAVELMQTSAKAAVFMQLPRSLQWKTLTSCCHKSSPKQVVEDNIGDGKAITYDHLYKILFDHVSLCHSLVHGSKAMHCPIAM